jgi:tight adherence protein B
MALVAVVALTSRVDGVAVAIVMATATGVGFVAVGEVRRSRGRERTQAALRDVTELVDVLAAELRAGVLPHHALRSVAREHAALAPAARVAALGGDVPAALRHAADRPGHAGLASVAAAWQLSDACGAPLAAVLDRVARALRFEADLVEEVRAAVEPARATARLLAVLPAMGLLLGSGLGADPFGVVTGTLAGALCLAAGCALACVGLRWIETTADRAERG